MAVTTRHQASGPFIHGGRSTRKLMGQALFALSLVAAAAVWRHGGHAAVLLGAALATAIGCEALCAGRERALDGSSVVAGCLIGLMLPADSPWWLAVAASALAILLGKHAFGGLGANVFNPAALSRAVLMGVAPAWFFAIDGTVDGTSAATHLAKGSGLTAPAWEELLLGGPTATLAEAAPVVVLVAGLLLVTLRTIDWRVPLTYLATISLLAVVLPPSALLDGHAPWLIGNPLHHLLAGGVPLAAFFLLTDPVTSPWSPSGRVAFAVAAALGTMLTRLYTPYPDGAVLGVLVANALVELIDRRTLGQPRRGQLALPRTTKIDRAQS